MTRTTTCIHLGPDTPPGSVQEWATGSVGGRRFVVASVDAEQLEGWTKLPAPEEAPDGIAVKHHDGSWLTACGDVPCMWRHKVPGRADDERLAARIAGVLAWAVAR